MPSGRPAKRLLRGRRRLLLAVIALLAAAVSADFSLPHRHLPWRPLAIDDQPGVATNIKLGLIGFGPQSWCQDLLAESLSLQTTMLDPHDGNGGCGWRHGVDIVQSRTVTLIGTPPYAMRCRLAAGAHIWLGSVDRRAREHLGSELARVHHVGTYSCRRMNNQPDAPMSEHAYANAWDVTGFELADGRVISVARHWSSDGPMRDFLRDVRNDACRVFDITLGPEFNAAHKDHFHLDMGGGSSCH